MIRVTPRISLPESEIELTFIRASGPGGQNVNKVATAVQLRFDAARSPSLPEDVRTRLMGLAGSRLTSGGEIVIEAQRYRSQGRNRDDAVHRLTELIRQAAEKPKPRIATKPTQASQERRLKAKRRRGEIKRGRVSGNE